MTSRDTMMNDKRTMHTPGPWKLMPEFHGDHGQYYITDEADGSEIASVTAWIGEHRAEAEANARLIATAPELLAALASIAEMTDPDDPESYRSDDREGCIDAVQAAARAAISKASVQS